MAYEYAIETKMLKKIYGEQVAVNNVSLHIPKGHIYGLLGRNGAGKTSIMKLLLRLISATSGEVYIFGQPVINRERRLFKRIGAIIETPGFYSNLTGTENLEIFAKLRGVTKPHAVEHALELVGLPYRDKKLFGEFVSIVIALPNLNFVYEVFLRYKELITYRETHKNGVIGGQQFEELYLANVSFSYNHSLNQKVLNDISLHIRPQELCAIVGFSGSGKSTLLKIILGLLSPDVGTVKINSIKANDFSHDRMYEWFSVVTQNPMCLNSSVRKNVDVTESFSDDDIWNALKVAELAVDIKSMPMGLDTFIGEQGQNISGGQRQRLAIARALLKKPQVLVFDEATSNLDPSTEKKIFENLSTMNMTKIIVTHRLSSIRMANQIIVLEKGQIVEKGTHDKLLENKGWYYKNLMKTDGKFV